MLLKIFFDFLGDSLKSAVVIIVASGCASMETQLADSETCKDPVGSVIHRVVPNPTEADLILQKSFGSGRSGIEMKILAKKFLNKLKSFAATADTYQSLAVFALAEIKKINAGVRPDERLIRDSAHLKQFQEMAIPITDYDRCLILKHIERARLRSVF